MHIRSRLKCFQISEYLHHELEAIQYTYVCKIGYRFTINYIGAALNRKLHLSQSPKITHFDVHCTYYIYFIAASFDSVFVYRFMFNTQSSDCIAHYLKTLLTISRSDEIYLSLGQNNITDTM